MKEKKIKGKAYKLPGSLTPFQEEMYVHLINWKWQNISKDVGNYNFKGSQLEYDAILPRSVQREYPLIYPKIIQNLKDHKKNIILNSISISITWQVLKLLMLIYFCLYYYIHKQTIFLAC